MPSVRPLLPVSLIVEASVVLLHLLRGPDLCCLSFFPLGIHQRQLHAQAAFLILDSFSS